MNIKEAIIHEIAKTIADSTNVDLVKKMGIGLYGEKSGIVLFLAHYVQRFPNSKYQETFDYYLEDLCKILTDEMIYSYTFASGLAGAMSALRLMNEQGMISLDISELEEQYKYTMAANMMLFLNRGTGSYDFMHGALGIALHYKNEKDFVELAVNWLKDNAIRENGVTKWKSVFNKEGKLGYNISLSHGMSSILIILCRLYETGNMSKEIEELINGIAGYILSQEIDRSVYGACFPAQSLENGDEIFMSRLGWCYGDLGVAIALWQAGKTLNKPEWQEKALDVMLFSTQRRELNINAINDGGICHGSIGVAMMFKYMYNETKDYRFAETAQYWTDVTLDLAKFDDGLAGYKIYKPDYTPQWQNSYNLLEGISGIGLALMSMLDMDKNDKWTELFLLY